tara:strand:+ start:295 stop:753 length:459 start_codon:yes stop_codon:yes gene_type:complete
MNIQNNAKNLNKILEVFSKDKVELESQKVELSLIDDVQKYTDIMSNEKKNLSKYATDVANIRLEYIRFMAKANDLYKKYGDDIVSEIESDLRKYLSTAEKLAAQAKEIGIDPQKIAPFKKFIQNYDDMEDSIDGLREHEEDLEKIIKSNANI